ncbi:MAG: hypothetical protein JW809_07205 [Pirellulales bacterium]|nr:hypothetical protein [Pirellulales bacterium]
MDFLNKAFAQLTDLFRSMTPGARITAGLLLAVVLVSVGYLFTYQISDPGEYLFGGEPFGYQYLSRIEMTLGAAGVEYKVDNGRIRVPRAQQSKAMGALVDADVLPPVWNQARKETLKNSSPFVSDKLRDAQREAAKEKDFETALEGMPGITRAQVKFDSTTQGRFPRTTLKTASIIVETQPGHPLTEERVLAIRNTAVTYAAGTKPENVNILDVTTGRCFPGDLDSGGAVLGDKSGVTKRYYEAQWRDKILGVVGAYIPGVTVETNVTLSDVKRHVTRTLAPDTKGTPVRTTEKTRDRTQEGPAPAGRPGFAANQPGAIAPANLKGSTETDSESETTEDAIVGGSSEEKEQVPMMPTRVQAVVGVPTSYFEKLWRDQNPPAEGEEPKKPTPADLTAVETREITRITDMVAGLLPDFEGVADKKTLVTVSSVRDLAPEPLPEPTMAETFLAWLGQYWSTLGMLALVGFSLLMLRSMIRSAPTEPRIGAARVPGEARHHEASADATEEETPKRENRLARFAKSGASLRDELSELVHEDTDAAANILRGWIGASTGKG